MTRIVEFRERTVSSAALAVLGILIGCSHAVVPHVVVDTTVAKRKTATFKFRIDSTGVRDRSWFASRNLFVDIYAVGSQGQWQWLCTLGESPWGWGYKETETVRVEPGLQQLRAEVVAGATSIVGALTGGPASGPDTFKSIATAEQTANAVPGIPSEVTVVLGGRDDEPGALTIHLETRNSNER
jgi:hypothetical protein